MASFESDDCKAGSSLMKSPEPFFDEEFPPLGMGTKVVGKKKLQEVLEKNQEEKERREHERGVGEYQEHLKKCREKGLAWKAIEEAKKKRLEGGKSGVGV